MPIDKYHYTVLISLKELGNEEFRKEIKEYLLMNVYNVLKNKYL
ncbi:hypothetical protein ACV3UY_13265 [Clostridium perfringens]